MICFDDQAVIGMQTIWFIIVCTNHSLRSGRESNKF